MEDVESIPLIGKQMKAKVKEILETGKLLRAEYMFKDEKIQIVDQLSKIWGIGPSTAVKLYQQGIRSVDDLKKNPQMLTMN